MTHSPLRDALLSQMGGASVAAELNALNELVNAQSRRARRLTIWTAVVWALWFAQFALYLGLPMLQQATAPARSVAPVQPPAATQPAADAPSRAGGEAPARPQPSAPPRSAFRVIVGTLLLGSFFFLPPVGIVLLILTIVARRSASMGQIRASLASIDAQLRLVLAQRPPPAGPQG